VDVAEWSRFEFGCGEKLAPLRLAVVGAFGAEATGGKSSPAESNNGCRWGSQISIISEMGLAGVLNTAAGVCSVAWNPP
jgi:hypothetical protein